MRYASTHVRSTAPRCLSRDTGHHNLVCPRCALLDVGRASLRRSVQRRSPDKVIDIALAEFIALRGLIATMYQMRLALLAGGLTAMGVVAGLALHQDSNRNLLLLIPALAATTVMINSELGRRIRLNGRYIYTKLWPFFGKTCRC